LHRVLKMKLQRQGDTYRAAAVTVFAHIPSPVDIVSTASGEFYVISRRAKQLYRLSPKKPREQ
ncbi:MAG: hypothetical protein KDA99_08185, partial [Planctomycetales bacterium]|nr:hypothetical protein [Planctomycetales bacterium]